MTELSRCCQESCSFEHQGDGRREPCWGDVDLVDAADTWDGRIWIHACSGHAEVAFGGDYTPDARVERATLRLI